MAAPKKKPPTFKLVSRVPMALATRFRIRCIREGITIQRGVAEAIAIWLRAKPISRNGSACARGRRR